jgi:hypothetical protein
MPTEREEAEDLATRYRRDFGPKTADGQQAIAVTPDTECASCSELHRFRVHDGRRLICTMAGCPCTGFRPKPEVKEPVFGI